MSFTGINKNNLKLKNISFMSPITHSKINVSNLISESQRITTNPNSNKITNTQNNNSKVQINLNKGPQVITDLYRSYSTNRPYITHQYTNKNNHNNSNYLNKSISKKNNYKKNVPSTSAMLTTFANFATNLNKNKNKAFTNFSFIGIKPNVIHKRNPTSHNEIRNIKKNSITANNSLTNINNISSNNNNHNSSFINQTQQINSNTEQKKKKTNKKINDLRNFSNDNMNNKNINFSSPLSPSEGPRNIHVYIHQIYKKVDNTKINNRNNKKSIRKNHIQTQSHQSENSQNAITTSQSTIGKKKIKSSTNSSKTEGEIKQNINGNIINNQNDINYNLNKNHLFNMNIDTPEELHFFYINVLQNGKELEGRFELTNTITP